MSAAPAAVTEKQACVECGALVDGRYYLNGRWVCRDCYNRMRTSAAHAIEQDTLP